ncbi:hypothetical protein K432DRAFT_378376 [Lepidopterella palustris CBS 459.81]|uniref:DUF7730 domain-containing protein n=1 Tax=Lepidopterella palustris CBS 459.81 TaxID=1314670 RepID=A0A8E2EIX1_9PEZI|nr:hypothetical protein K432DRAFT_378376 [Lepidopterella palustris CBS 459.81]
MEEQRSQGVPDSSGEHVRKELVLLPGPSCLEPMDNTELSRLNQVTRDCEEAYSRILHTDYSNGPWAKYIPKPTESILPVREDSSPHEQADSSQEEADFYGTLSNSPPAEHKPFEFLSLPAHLRQQIYIYLLADPTTSQTLVHIIRSPQIPCYKLTRPRPPKLTYRLTPPPASPFTTSLLLANRTIYNEALPVLYHHKTFYLNDLEGLLPIFLHKLSTSARTHIRSLRISADPVDSINSPPFFAQDRTKPSFHWAITCAQIAKLTTLHELEIGGCTFLNPGQPPNWPLLLPLCKIKATKKLVFPHDDPATSSLAAKERFAEYLCAAEDRLRASAKKREESARAEALERAQRHEQEIRDRAAAQEAFEAEQARLGQEWIAASKIPESDMSVHNWLNVPRISCCDIDRDLARVKGLKQFERELEQHSPTAEAEPYRPVTLVDIEADEGEFEIVTRPSKPPGYDDVTAEGWDIVSVRSRRSSTSMRSSSSSGEEWQDTASTLVEKANNDDDEEEAENKWEFIDK